jgi:hypothetical protein
VKERQINKENSFEFGKKSLWKKKVQIQILRNSFAGTEEGVF